MISKTSFMGGIYSGFNGSGGESRDFEAFAGLDHQGSLQGIELLIGEAAEVIDGNRGDGIVWTLALTPSSRRRVRTSLSLSIAFTACRVWPGTRTCPHAFPIAAALSSSWSCRLWRRCRLHVRRRGFASWPASYPRPDRRLEDQFVALWAVAGELVELVGAVGAVGRFAVGQFQGEFLHIIMDGCFGEIHFGGDLPAGQAELRESFDFGQQGLSSLAELGEAWIAFSHGGVGISFQCWDDEVCLLSIVIRMYG